MATTYFCKMILSKSTIIKELASGKAKVQIREKNEFFEFELIIWLHLGAK